MKITIPPELLAPYVPDPLADLRGTERQIMDQLIGDSLRRHAHRITEEARRRQPRRRPDAPTPPLRVPSVRAEPPLQLPA